MPEVAGVGVGDLPAVEPAELFGEGERGGAEAEPARPQGGGEAFGDQGGGVPGAGADRQRAAVEVGLGLGGDPVPGFDEALPADPVHGGAGEVGALEVGSGGGQVVADQVAGDFGGELTARHHVAAAGGELVAVEFVELVGDEVRGQGESAEGEQHGGAGQREREAGVGAEEVHHFGSGLDGPVPFLVAGDLSPGLGGQGDGVQAPGDGLGVGVEDLAGGLRERGGDAPVDGQGDRVVGEPAGHQLLDELGEPGPHGRGEPGEVGGQGGPVLLQRQHQDVLLAQFDGEFGVPGGARVEQFAGGDPVAAVLAQSGAALGQADRAAAAHVRVGEVLVGVRQVREPDLAQPQVAFAVQPFEEGADGLQVALVEADEAVGDDAGGGEGGLDLFGGAQPEFLGLFAEAAGGGDDVVLGEVHAGAEQGVAGGGAGVAGADVGGQERAGEVAQVQVPVGGGAGGDDQQRGHQRAPAAAVSSPWRASRSPVMSRARWASTLISESAMPWVASLTPCRYSAASVPAPRSTR